MKIAISSIDGDIKGNIAESFGRCSHFIIVEIEDGKIGKTEAIRNENTNQASGAGISAAKLMAENNVDAVIAGNMGPRALDILKQFNINVYSGDGAIQGVLKSFTEGKLKKLTD